MRAWLAGLCALSALAAAGAARGEVVQKADGGFVVRSTAMVAASSALAWRTLTTPSAWWLAAHTFSGDAANLTLDPVPGGCFCEKLPPPRDASAGQRPGGVQHMRAIYVEPGRVLRLSGALGPLQGEAVNGTLTITLKPMDGGDTRILFEYVVGGFMRYPVDQIAPAVDKVMAGQLASLARKLGPVGAAAPGAENGVQPGEGAAPAAEAPAATAPAAPGPARGWSLPPGRKPVAAPAAKAPAAKPAAKAPPRPAPRPVPAATPAALPPPAEGESDVNAAFDAALGAPPPR